MAFLQGNHLWKNRTKHGRDRLFSSAPLLWEEACKYFAWCDSNPWVRWELTKYQGMAEEDSVPIGRPYTIEGVCVYLGVSASYFRGIKHLVKEHIEEGRNTPEEMEMLETVIMIETVIRAHQLEGAILGVYTANLVARINGIHDTINTATLSDATLKLEVRDQRTADNVKALREALKQ